MNTLQNAMSGLAIKVGLCALLCSLPVVAQQEVEAEDSYELIMVTAQKRQQSTQDVGINMSVLGEEQIALRRIETVNDIIVFSPNIGIKENVPGIMPVITIRGVGLNDFNATNNPAAGVYVDGVSLSSLALLNFDFLDLARVEVLRGPQGTLYGRNSTAGAVNIVSATPEQGELYSRLSATVGNYKTSVLEGMLNLPVSDDLAIRIAAKGSMQDEGYWFNDSLSRDIGRREAYQLRAQTAWRISEDADMQFKIDTQNAHSELGSAEFFGIFPGPDSGPETCPGAPQCSNFFGYTDTDNDPFRGSWSANPDYAMQQLSSSLKWNIAFDDIALSSITAYIDFDRQYASDVDASPLRLVDFNNEDKVKQFSQELHLSSSNEGMSWLAGVFYATDKVRTTYAGDLQDLFNTTTFSSADQKATSRAVFGNIEWALAEQLDLVTGLRYTREKRANVGFTQDLVSEFPFSALTMAPYGTPPITLAAVDETITDSNWSWKLGLNWHPQKHQLIYASASQGTKSGGFFAGVATNSGQLQPYQPEDLIAYEVGIKSQLPALGLSIEGSTFYYDYSDVQTFIRDIVGSLPIQRLGNVEKATIYGADVNLLLRPRSMDGLKLDVGLGLLHTELGEFDSSAGPVEKGNRLPDAPSHTYNLGASYEWELSDDMFVRLALDSRYQSETFRDSLNDPLLAAAGYWVTNGQITLHSEAWSLSLWGKNLRDERYVTQGLNQLVFGNGFRVYGAPRTFGLTFTYNFE